MAYGDLSIDAPSKPNKGHEDGACNRRACQAEPANWYNHGSHSWYCLDCAKQIGEDVVNARCWPADFARMFPDRPLHPMFETREMMDARQFGAVDDVVGLLISTDNVRYDVDQLDQIVNNMQQPESRQVRRARERRHLKELYRHGR